MRSSYRDKRHWYLCLLFAAVYLSPIGGLRAQGAHDHLWGTDRRIDASVVVNDTLFVGGPFFYVGPPTGQLVAIDRTTGEVDLSWPRIGGPVFAIEPDGSGGFFVGGAFNWADGHEFYNLVHILSDGTLRHEFRLDPISSQDHGHAGVWTIRRSGDTLYIGGLFDEVAGAPRTNIAAIEISSGQLLPEVLNLSGSFPGSGQPWVHSINTADDVLYLSGSFLYAGDKHRPGMVVLHKETWEVLPWTAEFDGGVRSIAIGDSLIYVTGHFRNINGQSRRWFGAVSVPDEQGGGGAVATWNPGQSPGSTLVRNAADQLAIDGSHVYAIGNLGAPGNPSGFIKIDRMTGESTIFASSANIQLGGAFAFDDDKVFLAGNRKGPFESSREIVLIDTAVDGSEAGDLFIRGGEPRFAGLSNVHAVAVTQDLMLAGGSFTSLGGEPRRYIAGIDLTTGEPTGLDPQPFSSVVSMTASPDGQHLYWVTFNGIGVTNLHTNESWTYWQPSTAAEREAFRAALQVADDGAGHQDGPLFLGGDRPYMPPALKSATLRAEGPRVRGGQRLMVATEDRLYVGGLAFERLSGEIAWQTPISVFDSEPFIGEVLVFGEGGLGGAGDTLVISGDIFRAGGITRHDLVALDAATGAVLDWYPGPTYNTAAVFGITLAENILYAGGRQIWEIAGHQRNNMIAVDMDTAEILPWAPNVRGGTHMNPEVWTLDYHNGVIYVGGGFGTVNGEFQLRAAALDAETADLLDWNPHFQHYWVDPFPGVRTIIVSPEHERVFLTGSFMNSAKGAGHANVVGLSLVGAEPPVTTEPGALPITASLSAPFPNPARNAASLTLSLPEAGSVEVAVFDVLGRRVAVMHEGPLAAGEHALALDASRLASGLYVVRAAGEGFGVSRRITVVR